MHCRETLTVPQGIRSGIRPTAVLYSQFHWSPSLPAGGSPPTHRQVTLPAVGPGTSRRGHFHSTNPQHVYALADTGVFTVMSSSWTTAALIIKRRYGRSHQIADFRQISAAANLRGSQLHRCFHWCRHLELGFWWWPKHQRHSKSPFMTYMQTLSLYGCQRGRA